MLDAPGFAISHTYRAPFLRSSDIVHLRPERAIADADKDATAIVNFIRPRAYFGLPRDVVEVIGRLPEYHTITNYVVTPVVALVEPPESFVFDAGEVAAIFEVPLELLLDTRRYESKILTKQGLNVPFFEIRHDGHRIWGATAGMLRDLCRKVGAVHAIE